MQIPYITSTMLSRQPDQVSEILRRMIDHINSCDQTNARGRDELRKEFGREQTEQNAQDKALNDRLLAEEKARAEKDTELEGEINTEADAREAKDTELEAEIKAEQKARGDKDTELEEKINTKQDRLTAGANITIEDNVISAKDFTIGDGSITASKVNWQTFLDKIYPVGSIYISTDSANPSSKLGGTWQEYGQGRVLVGYNSGDSNFSTMGKTGGSDTVTLNTNQMPTHSHYQNISAGVDNGPAVRLDYTADAASGRGAIFPQGITTNAEGGGQAHNNLQPYIVVKMWRRTA